GVEVTDQLRSSTGWKPLQRPWLTVCCDWRPPSRVTAARYVRPRGSTATAGAAWVDHDPGRPSRCGRDQRSARGPSVCRSSSVPGAVTVNSRPPPPASPARTGLEVTAEPVATVLMTSRPVAVETCPASTRPSEVTPATQTRPLRSVTTDGDAVCDQAPCRTVDRPEGRRTTSPPEVAPAAVQVPP